MRIQPLNLAILALHWFLVAPVTSVPVNLESKGSGRKAAKTIKRGTSVIQLPKITYKSASELETAAISSNLIFDIYDIDPATQRCRTYKAAEAKTLFLSKKGQGAWATEHDDEYQKLVEFFKRPEYLPDVMFEKFDAAISGTQAAANWIRVFQGMVAGDVALQNTHLLLEKNINRIKEGVFSAKVNNAVPKMTVTKLRDSIGLIDYLWDTSSIYQRQCQARVVSLENTLDGAGQAYKAMEDKDIDRFIKSILCE
ncbi:hypothetical protein MCOR25_011212 [Pyricularia grisea]|nr:hypothetical protein MCOR25_011212 [Pyricularia grisea]